MIVPYLRVFSHISDPAKLFIVVVDHLQGQRDELRPLGFFFSCTQSDRSGGSPVQIAPDLLTTALEPLFPRAYNGCARCPPLVFVLSSPVDLDTPLEISSFVFFSPSISSSSILCYLLIYDRTNDEVASSISSQVAVAFRCRERPPDRASERGFPMFSA